jgi:hypothetical protein
MQNALFLTFHPEVVRVRVVHNLVEYLEEHCPICLLEFRPRQYAYITECWHFFHAECLRRYISSYFENYCPICRQMISKE